MHLTNIKLAIIGLAALLLLPLPAAAESINAKYDAEWNGLRIGEMTVTVDEQSNNYTYSVILTAEGLLKTFTHYRSENTSKGKLSKGAPIPASYFTEWWRKKEHQQVSVAYTNNGKKVVETATPPEKRPKRPIVPAKYKDNTLDPVLAALVARDRIREIVEAGKAADETASFPKKITLPVFDGRRRFDVELTINGYKKKKYDGKKQNLLEIVFFRTPVNGFNDKELVRMKEQDPTVIFYLNNDYIPVMGSGNAPFGSASVELTKLSYSK